MSKQLFPCITPRDEAILRLYLVEKQSREDIALLYCLSRERIGQILNKSLQRIGQTCDLQELRERGRMIALRELKILESIET